MALPWADLTPDLLIQVADRLDDLESYVSARGACKSWRRALVPPFPALLVATEDQNSMSLSRPTATSLAMRKSFELAAISSGCRCVGSSNGWLALCIRVKQRSGDSVLSNYYHTAFFLVNPVAGLEIKLPPLFEENRWISKLVFTPCPTKDDFAAVAICNGVRIIYVTARATSWAVRDFKINGRDQFMDLVYHDEGNKVYCLTRSGDVHILHLPKRRLRRQKPAIVHQEGLKLSVLRRPPKGIQVWSPNCLDIGITVPVSTIDPYWKGSVESSDLNAPATVEPLLSADSYSFSAATAFAPPFDALSAIIDAKYLVFCEGNLYQVWRNTSCTVNLRVPGVSCRHRVTLGEVFVLRYYPDRWPCWDVVKDLGGYSFFVGKNNAVSLYAEGMPGLRGNCVYWIDGHGREKGTIFDVETGRSTPCQSPEAVVGAAPAGYKRTISFWYFLSDVVTTNS